MQIVDSNKTLATSNDRIPDYGTAGQTGSIISTSERLSFKLVFGGDRSHEPWQNAVRSRQV